MKCKDLDRLLRLAGFQVRPGKGSHFVYTHPDGRTMTLKLNIPSKDAGRAAEQRVRKVLEGRHDRKGPG